MMITPLMIILIGQKIFECINVIMNVMLINVCLVLKSKQNNFLTKSIKSFMKENKNPSEKFISINK